MATLTYLTNMSLDGFIEDEHGSFEWSQPSDEYFAFITDLLRPVGTYLYGRRLYEAMTVWETDPSLAAQSALYADFARTWQGIDKIVYSTTLDAVSTANSRLDRHFDADAIRATKAGAPRDLLVGGAHLAGQALRAGLVDECQLFVHPAVVGRGKPALPGELRARLQLRDEHRFDNGAVYLRYGVTG